MINIIAEIVLADGVIDVALDDEVMPSFKSRGSAFSMATVAAGTWEPCHFCLSPTIVKSLYLKPAAVSVNVP